MWPRKIYFQFSAWRLISGVVSILQFEELELGTDNRKMVRAGKNMHNSNKLNKEYTTRTSKEHTLAILSSISQKTEKILAIQNHRQYLLSKLFTLTYPEKKGLINKSSSHSPKNTNSRVILPSLTTRETKIWTKADQPLDG